MRYRNAIMHPPFLLSLAARIRADSVLPEPLSRATGTVNLAHGPGSVRRCFCQISGDIRALGVASARETPPTLRPQWTSAHRRLHSSVQMLQNPPGTLDHPSGFAERSGPRSFDAGRTRAAVTVGWVGSCLVHGVLRSPRGLVRYEYRPNRVRRQVRNDEILNMRMRRNNANVGVRSLSVDGARGWGLTWS